MHRVPPEKEGEEAKVFMFGRGSGVCEWTGKEMEVDLGGCGKVVVNGQVFVGEDRVEFSKERVEWGTQSGLERSIAVFADKVRRTCAGCVNVQLTNIQILIADLRPSRPPESDIEKV